MATAHAVLAAAAAIGLSAHLDTLDTQAWRDAAATISREDAANRRKVEQGYG
jgi:hypothetical protein